MRWTDTGGEARHRDRSFRRRYALRFAGAARTAVALGIILLFLLCAGSVRSADEKRLTIYSPGRATTVALVEHNRTEYVDLIAVLEPLGRLDVRQDGRKWKLRLNGEESQFQEGKTKAKVRGHDYVLSRDFVADNGRALVPLASLAPLLQSLLRETVHYHPSGSRMFIAAAANQYTTQIDAANPPRVVFNFAAPVSPNIANEPGRMQIVFQRDPVIATGPDTVTIKDSAISSVTNTETNGQAEITIKASAPLVATFSNGGKTLTVAPVQQAVAVPRPPVAIPQVTPAPPPVGSGTTAVAPPPRLPQHRFLVVIDPSHGGDERGAALSETLAEKDVTLAFGRGLRNELQSRGIEVLLLRDGDATLSTDQRAVLANTNHPALYVTIHAGSVGSGVRLYTSMMPADNEAARGDFIPWDLAQAGFLSSSRAMASALAGEIQSRRIEVRVLSASLPPLNHIAAAAIGLEVAPRAGTDVNDLTSITYQQALASGLAAGIVAAHNRAEAR